MAPAGGRRGLPPCGPAGLPLFSPAFPLCFRYLFLLTGGGALAAAAMGPYAALVFIPAVCAVLLVCSLGPQAVHRWTFLFQMSWQTLCHLGLQYTEHYLQEPPSTG